MVSPEKVTDDCPREVVCNLLSLYKRLLIKYYIKNLPRRLVHTDSRIRSFGVIKNSLAEVEGKEAI